MFLSKSMLINTDIFEFPVSLILAAVFVSGVLLAGISGSRSRLITFLSGRKCSILLISISAVMLAVEGTWQLRLFRHWSFLTLVLITMFCLGLTLIDGIRKKRSLTFLLSHSGLLLVLAGGFFGAPDRTDARMSVTAEEFSHSATDIRGMSVTLPFDVRLIGFTTDYYDDGTSPRQYTSTLSLDGTEVRTSVNHPARHRGYLIYQYGFDREYGRYSVLKTVRDPWLPIVFIGMLILVSGAVISLKHTWQSKAVIPVALVTALLFGIISLAKINLGTLVPALRSLWFVPHIIIYMVAYSLLAIAVIVEIFKLCGKEWAIRIAGRLVSTASSLLLLGMICGAIWAQRAWGDYWTWDGKESWAAVTWLITLVATHLPQQARRLAAFAVILSFLAMQMTWYGVDYLPSAPYSLHTYK